MFWFLTFLFCLAGIMVLIAMSSSNPISNASFKGESEEVVVERQEDDDWDSSFLEADAVVRPVQEDPIHIYESNQFVKLTPYLSAFIDSNDKGMLYIDQVVMSPQPLESSGALTLYDLVGEQKHQMIDALKDHLDAWDIEKKAFETFESRIYRYNEERHRIRKLEDGRHVVLPKTQKGEYQHV